MEMNMKKIDLTKCNNLRYKAKVDGNDDYGRICVENADTGLAFLRSDREDGYIATWHCDVPGIDGCCGRKVTDFEIIPRDPETYQDWQVGDKVCEDKHRNACYEVIFRSGELVVFKDWNNWASNPMTCSEAFMRFGMRLVLTDIENRIIEEKKVVEDIPKPHEFRKGEPVLVRTDYGRDWVVAVYVENSSNPEAQFGKYGATDGRSIIFYRFCIPYNERTMHLLGTSEDYKEE